jgi:ribokinase
LILSLGSINCDLRLDGVEDMSSGGTVRASSLHEASGGKAANAAFFCHRIGEPTSLIGRVGRDHYAEEW